MPERPKFELKEKNDGWFVDVPATMSANGKRERPWFEDRKHAEAFAKKMRGKYARGERGVTLDQTAALDAQEAARILNGTGISLVDAARAALAAHVASGKSEPFQQRYQRAMLDGEGRWRAPYLRDMGKLPQWVSESFMARQCSVITADGIKDELAGRGSYKQSTIQHRARYISAILNWKPRHRKAKKIEILSDDQVTAFLDAAETPAQRRCGAVLLFAGIRPSVDDGEITRLEWAAFSTAEIYVAEEVAKTGSDRHIPLTARLEREIAGHPADGPVMPPRWAKAYARMRKAAGTKASDVTRHTFASHYLAACGEDKTKAAMGHTADSRTLFRHYRKAVTEANGLKYFA